MKLLLKSIKTSDYDSDSDYDRNSNFFCRNICYENNPFRPHLVVCSLNYITWHYCHLIFSPRTSSHPTSALSHQPFSWLLYPSGWLLINQLPLPKVLAFLRKGSHHIKQDTLVEIRLDSFLRQLIDCFFASLSLFWERVK